MKHLKLCVAAGVLVGSLSLSLLGQTTDIDKKCSLPKVTYQEGGPPPPDSSKHSGAAVLDVVVDEKGRVSEAKLSQSSGNDEYDRQCLSAVLKWKFKPAMCDGKAKRGRILVKMDSQVM